MALGYGYVKREASDYVDWSKISSDLSKTLLEEKKRREDIKDALEEQLRKDVNFLAQPPQGESISGNEFTQKYASDASEYMLMINRKLKSGELDPRDYKIMAQNMMDDTGIMFETSKKFQESYKKTMDRYKNGNSQSLELYSRSQIEGFSDFANTQAYIDPMSGRVKLAKKVKKIVDGKEVFVMSDNPDDVTSVSTLLNQATAEYNKFDTNAALDQYAKSLGKEIDAIRSIGGGSRSGQVLSIQDITRREYADPKTKEIIYNFMEAETNAINALLANPYNRTSVLTEDMKFIDGKEVGYTTDPNKAKENKNLILMKVDPSSGGLVPDFENSPHGKEQLKIATEWLRDQARSRYDRVKGIETYQEQTPRPPSSEEIRAGLNKKQIKQGATILGQIYSGDSRQITEAMYYLQNSDPTIVDVQREPNGVTVYRINPQTGKITGNTASFVDGSGNPIGYKGFLNEITPLAFGQTDTDVIAEIDRSLGGKAFNTTKEKFRVSQKKAEQETEYEMGGDFNISGSKTKTKISPVMGDAGTGTGTGAGDAIFGR
jgi:hypothetical protein